MSWDFWMTAVRETTVCDGINYTYNVSQMYYDAFGEQLPKGVRGLDGLRGFERRDYRDVDVRIIVSDEKWRVLFGDSAEGHVIPFWSLVCAAISEYMSRRCDLPIDFQIQRRSSVSAEDWKRPRNPLALYPSNIGPAWRKADD